MGSSAILAGFASLVALTFLGGIALALLRKGRKPPYFAHAEYWVYLPGDQMPLQDAIMNRMLRESPRRHGGKYPITKTEALLFSDVRLHIALVLRARNAHVFRPDLFEEHVEPTPDRLAGLADSNSFVKIRFISEDPLQDHRHLRFLIHAADAVATLGNGKAIYDVTAEALYTTQELGAALDQADDAASPELHSRVVWRRSSVGGTAETRGLVKVGHPELATEEMNADQRVLVTAILEEVIRELWEQPQLPPTVDVRYFEDPYRVEIGTPRKGKAPVALMKLPG